MQIEFARALGIVALGDDGKTWELRKDLLAAYKPPPDATDEGVLMDVAGPLCINPRGTRIDPILAQRLWTLRGTLEDLGTVTASSWCTLCGRHFIDMRRASYKWHPRIARYCGKPCRNSKLAKAPQLRACAAADCGQWFRPAHGNKFHCSEACKAAAYRARRLERERRRAAEETQARRVS